MTVAGRSPLLVAVEVGTTGARSVAVDLEGRVVDEVRCPYPTSTPVAGWAEQDARRWSGEAEASLGALAACVGADRIAGIGLTGQTPTVVPVDARCRPLRPGMLYRDNRAVLEAAALSSRFGERALHDRTGHTPAAFHVGPKVLWLRAHEPDVFDRTRYLLQPRDVVLHRLTGAVLTDESHADGTLFFDLVARRWAVDLLEAVDLDDGLFPGAVPPWTLVGPVARAPAGRTGLGPDVPVVIGAGDSQCAAFGAGLVRAGAVSEMAGSSSCINTVVVRPRRDLRITHYSHAVPGVLTTEVGLNTTGAAVRWAVERLGFGGYDRFAAAAEAGRLRVRSACDPLEAAPLFVPHLGDGERDDPGIRAAFLGLSERHGRDELAYAVVEGIAFAVAGEVGLLRPPGGTDVELRVAGGGTRLDVLGQAKADALGAPVRHLDVDTSAVGAALLAAGAVGFGEPARSAIAAIVQRARSFEPDLRAAAAVAARRRWWRRARRGGAVRRAGERRRR